MKKLFLLMALASVAFAGYSAERANGSSEVTAQAARSNVYTLDTYQISIPVYGEQATVTILKNGQPAQVGWSIDARVFNFDMQPSGEGAYINVINTDSAAQGCYGSFDVYVDGQNIGTVVVNP